MSAAAATPAEVVEQEQGGPEPGVGRAQLDAEGLTST